MTPEELAAEIERLIMANSVKFAGTITSIQGAIYNRLIGILRGLELDGEGYIKQSATNRKILREAQNVFDDVITNSPYQNAVENHLKAIPGLDKINNAYFSTLSDRFTPNKNFLKELQKQVIEDVNANLLNEGVIAQVKLPLNNILSQNINSGGSFSGFQEQLRTFIKGNDDVEGRLLKYTRTYTSDTLFGYSRSLQESVTADLNLEFYFYGGGTTERSKGKTGKGKGSGGSREFCLERRGKYFHRKEIESWAGLEWQGKNPLTTKSSIFMLCGGFNCKDSLIPVSEKVVTLEVIDRVKKLGYL